MVGVYVGGGVACMALVRRSDTNQDRWRAPLSCKRQPLLVLFKCLPSLFLPPLTLAQPLPPPLPPQISLLSTTPQLNPWLNCHLLSGRPFAFSSPRKSAVSQERTGGGEEEGEEGSSGPEEGPLSWGSFCVSHGAVSRPGRGPISYSNVTIRPSDPQGGSLWLRPSGRRVKMVI